MLFREEHPFLAANCSVDMSSAPGKLDNFQRIQVFEVVTQQGLSQTSATSGTIFCTTGSKASDGQWKVYKIEVTAHVAGGSGAALDIVQAADGTAIASGTSVLASTVDLSAITADTRTEASLTTTTANLTITAGSRLGYKLSGTLTGLADCCVSVFLVRVA